jgi:hypothetical protein
MSALLKFFFGNLLSILFEPSINSNTKSESLVFPPSTLFHQPLHRRITPRPIDRFLRRLERPAHAIIDGTLP